MLYLATIQHSARQCPGVESETFKEFLAAFSAAQLEKAHIKVVGAYIDQSCLTGLLGKEHVTTFALEADSVAKVNALLGPLRAEVRQVVSWNSPSMATGK
jgi:hypothetical protein